MNLGFFMAMISVLLIAMTAGSMVAAGQTQRASNPHAPVIGNLSTTTTKASASGR
jgi:hypothetical protein